jgi:hypothetical protein
MAASFGLTTLRLQASAFLVAGCTALHLSVALGIGASLGERLLVIDNSAVSDMRLSFTDGLTASVVSNSTELPTLRRLR